jgi:hypothetical protein
VGEFGRSVAARNGVYNTTVHETMAEKIIARQKKNYENS